MLLESGRIGRLELPNRVIVSPHGTNTAGERGEVTDEEIAYCRRRAEGGVGAIIVPTVRVATSVDGIKMMARQLCIDDNSYIPGFLRLTESIHREGSKAIIQLFIGAGGRVIVGGELGQWHPWSPQEPVSPSGISVSGYMKSRALSTAEVEQIVEYVVKGAFRAKMAEFDAVHIHAASLYLLHEFISPIFNKRTDKYGTDRLKLLLEIVQGIREVNGEDFPIIVRHTVATWPYTLDETFEEREEVKEAKIIARRLEEAGVDAIQTSYNFGPEAFSIPSSHWPEDFSIPQARALKHAVSIPIILTCRIRDPEHAESILREGDADFIGVARAVIADPDWLKKYAENRVLEICNCIACNECSRVLRQHIPIRCSINPTAGRELEYDYRKLKPAEKIKKVMVIGAGPGGMEAARVGALRGHQVTLVEKEGDLGKKLELASMLPGRRTFKDIISYYVTAFKALSGKVDIARGSDVTPELVDEMEKEGMMPDVFIVATGGVPFIPAVPGVEEENVITFVDALADESKIGNTVVIVGGNIIGCEIALLLVHQGKKVTLVELPGFRAKDDIDGKPVEGNIWAFTDQELRSQANISRVTAEKLDKIADKHIFFADKAGNSLVFDFETIILSLGLIQKKKDELAKHLASNGNEVYIIGDAKRPRRIRDAIYEGFMVGSRI